MNAKKLHFQSFKNAAIVQFQTDFLNTFDYISLSEGMKKKLIEVKEISETGSVNNLMVINRSEFFVFMSDGDILKGAKQNRVLNTSVLIEPDSKTVIPVSCVEAGRWRHTSHNFGHEEFSAPVHMRSSKASMVKNSLNEKKCPNSDQGKIWNEISEYQDSFSIHSETSNLSDVFGSMDNDFDDILKNLKPKTDSNGLAIFVNGNLLNLEIYNRSAIYNEYFPRLLKGAFLEIFKMKKNEREIQKAEAFYKTIDFLDNYENIKFELHKGVAAGNEKRFDTPELSGLELIYIDKTIHLAALNLIKESREFRDYI